MQLRKTALVYRPLSTLTATVTRKLPPLLCPPLRRLVEVALPATDELEAWCADTRTPALFPSGLAHALSPLPRLQLRHNRRRFERVRYSYLLLL